MGILTDFPERISPGAVLFMGNKREAITVKSVRHHNKGFLIRFEEYEGIEAIENWRNVEVFVPATDRPPLPEGEYYLHELIGIAVKTDEGQALGTLADVLETGANMVYVVHNEAGNEVLLPGIDEVILKIDLIAREMTVHLLDGLI